MNIEMQGMGNVLNAVDGLVDPQKMQQALGKACALVERTAKQKAPKDTGALRRSITSKVEGNVGIVFTPLEYAPYIEYGTGLFAENGGRTNVPWNYQDDEGNWHETSGLHPHPYMRPALYENREKIKRILKEGLVKK